MDFLMSAFERVITQYGYKFTLIKNNNGTYTLNLFELPPELDYALINLKMDKTTEVVEPIKNVNGRKGETHTVLKTEHLDICKPKRGKGGVNIIYVEFNQSDYATKINKIEICLRTHFEKQHKTAF